MQIQTGQQKVQSALCQTPEQPTVQWDDGCRQLQPCTHIEQNDIRQVDAETGC